MSTDAPLLGSYYKKHNDPDVFLDFVQRDASGGKITREKIDEINNAPEREAIKISGLTQDTFDYFIDHYAHKFKAIYFWKCPNIPDLSRLEQLKDIEYIYFYGNKKATRLWDFSANNKLKGLLFEDFTKMHDLEDVAQSKTLKALSFGNAFFSVSYELESFKPLEGMRQLESLSFSVRKIRDNDITPLTKLTALKFLEFSASLLTVRELAYLKAHLPNVESSNLQPYILLPTPIGDEDCLVNGKRMPFLNSQKDAKRLLNYIKKFDELTHYFSVDLTRLP